MNSRNRWFVATIVIIPSAIFGIGYYLVGRDFALSVASIFATIIVAAFGILNQETKTTDRLREHSQTLIKEVEETWFVEREVYHDYSAMPYGLVFFTAIYAPHSMSEIRPISPKHIEQIEAHLMSGYRDLNSNYVEGRKAAKEHLENVVGFWQGLEDIVSKKVVERCPTISEWDSNRKTRSVDSFDLKLTVNLVYLELLSLVLYERKFGYFKEPQPTKTEQGEYFIVGQGDALRSIDRAVALSFFAVVNEVIEDKTFQESVRRSEEEKKAVYSKIDIFRSGLEKIKDDFEHGYQNLKGSCLRCDQLRRTG
jgi:hypothetical protein